MMIAVLALVMLADFATFIAAVPTVGISNELNPIMRLFYEQTGPILVGTFKLIAFTIIILLVKSVTEHRRKYAISLAIGITMIGILGNTTSYLLR
jgi:hypothetical protein